MAKDFAIIATGGKQYKVAVGEKLKVELLDGTKGDVFSFDKVMLRSADGKVEIGAPYLPKATVDATLLGDVRGKKKIVFKYHSKTRYRKKKGHRQDYTEVSITKV